MGEAVITVGRQCGSGGRAIARKLAGALSIPFYDKQLIEIAAKETGLSEEFIRQAEEQRTSSFLYNLYFNAGNLPLPDQVFLAEANVIKRVAAEGPCVIVGRCADYILRDHPGCLHVFIHAPLEQRMRRACAEYGVEQEGAKAFITKKDRARASYYNHFTTGRWGDCSGYDLTVNSGLGEEAVLGILLELDRRRGSEK